MQKLYIKTKQLKAKSIDSVEKLLLALYDPRLGYRGFPETFSKENCHYTSITCRRGKARSFGDIYSIVLAYFPKTTERDLMKLLYRLLNNGIDGMFIYCPNVKKMVIHPGSWDRYKINEPRQENSKVLIDNVLYDYANGIKKSQKKRIKYVDGYTFNKLFRMVGYNNKELFALKRWEEKPKKEKVSK